MGGTGGVEGCGGGIVRCVAQEPAFRVRVWAGGERIGGRGFLGGVAAVLDGLRDCRDDVERLADDPFEAVVVGDSQRASCCDGNCGRV